MKLIFTLFSFLVLNFNNCEEKLLGSSAEEFESSRIEVVKNLTTEEQENLEKAIRVVVSYALDKKWNEPDKYTDKSINEITLDVVNNKTYNNLVSFAEDYLKKSNEEKIKNIEIEISETKLDRKIADSVITILEAFTPTEINIDFKHWDYNTIWDHPVINVKIVNKGHLTEVTECMFLLNIYSISQNKRIDASVSFGERKSLGRDGYFIKLSRPLSGIIETSKRLEKQLKNSKYPITNLKEYDLRVEVIPSEIVIKDGTRYNYPEKSLADYDAEIEILQEQLKHLKSLDGRLDEYVIQETDPETEKAYNEEFLPLLKEIRETKNKSDERTLEINKNLTFTFPSKYEIKREKSPGFYSYTLSDSLSFDNSDENLTQYQIRDTAYVEYEDENDKAKGQLNILKKKEHITFDIKETINTLKTTNYYKLIDADDSGYIYSPSGGSYELVRYCKINGTHYHYTMNFKNLNDCVQEFDRSKDFIK